MGIESIFNKLRGNRLTTKLAALLLLQRRVSYLSEVGWFVSFKRFLPVNRKGDALPWYTYAAIDFFTPRVKKQMRVFEYGSGNSTRWWAERVSSVVSCEHDEAWFARMKPSLPENVEYVHFELIPAGDYSRAILQYKDQFDVVVIDGRDRINCIKNSMEALKNDGIVIWDNSDRIQYDEGYEYLIKHGFKRIDFSGLGPINAHGWCTSVFYRANNCFGI